jgi:carboxymethylenebutenolidase
MATPWPEGAQRVPISRAEGQGRVIEEAVATYVHEGTGRTIRLPHVVARDDAGERLYFDGATVLVQAGLLDPAGLPVCGAEQADKALDPRGRPTNTLMARWPQKPGTPSYGPVRRPAARARTRSSRNAALASPLGFCGVGGR